MQTLRLPEPIFPVPIFETDWIRDLDESIQADICALLTLKHKVMILDTKQRLSAAQKVDQAEVLRVAITPLVERLSPFFTRKPVPQSDVEYALFVLNSSVLKHLALVFLRAILPLARQRHERLGLCVHRAAIVVRYWQWQSWLAGRTPSMTSVDWLLGLLEFAHQNDLMAFEKVDRASHRQSKSSVGGQIAWALMLIAARPVRLNLAQLLMTQRICDRWREMVHFLTQKVGLDSISFGTLYPQAPTAAVLSWLDFSGVLRKIEQHYAALNRGQTPMQLKLGTELDTPGTKQLLKILKKRYQQMVSVPQVPPQDPRAQLCDLYFDSFNAYPIFLNNNNHPRISCAPAEEWTQFGTFFWRDVKTQGARHLSPHLVASDSPARLGIISALCEDDFGGLFGTVSWFVQHVEAGRVLLDSKAAPAFLLQENAQHFLLVPFDTPLTLQQEYVVSGFSLQQITPTQLAERGANFLRYSLR